MKKILIISTILLTLLSFYKKEQQLIPEESIRFRIIANSNIEEDQRIKQEIIRNLSQELKTIQSFQTINETRDYIIKDLPKMNEIVKNTLEESESFHINYGKNYFPEKEYQNEQYPEGEYESLVITLGEGQGDNFWCVLFPPLCFIEEKENIEYKSWIKEMIEKYF